MNSKPKYNPQIHHRRSIRLVHYDYTRNGAYFITICTHKKIHLFGEIAEGSSSCPEVVLNVAGAIAERCWLQIPVHFPHVETDEYVIMPNHVHGIIIVSDGGTRRGKACLAPTRAIERFGKPIAGSIPTIIGSYKSAVTRAINEINSMSGVSIWQRNYYEHVIRNDNDLYEIRKYIRDNPAKWESDEYNPAYQHR
jgi:REP element-mobilizing transposase RayT